MAVDTHVFRVAHRLGLSDGKNVKETEEHLVKKLKGHDLHIFHQAMVLYGRYVCKAIKPDCDNCLFPHVCKTKQTFHV
jgi:endonuclease-3